LSGEEIEKIFKGTENFYRAYAKEAAPLPLDGLSQKVWQFAEIENGGFDASATKYLTNLGLLGRH
jgi:hypothetical protein